MKRNDAFPKTYLTKDDVHEPVNVHIADVAIKSLGSGENAEEKPVLMFTENMRPMVLNATNWDILEKAFGNDSDLWHDKAIQLYADPTVSFGGKQVGGIRIRVSRDMTPAEKWLAFTRETPVSQELITKAIGFEKPSEYLKAHPEQTIEDVIEIVMRTINESF